MAQSKATRDVLLCARAVGTMGGLETASSIRATLLPDPDWIREAGTPLMTKRPTLLRCYMARMSTLCSIAVADECQRHVRRWALVK